MEGVILSIIGLLLLMISIVVFFATGNGFSRNRSLGVAVFGMFLWMSAVFLEYFARDVEAANLAAKTVLALTPLSHILYLWLATASLAKTPKLLWRLLGGALGGGAILLALFFAQDLTLVAQISARGINHIGFADSPLSLVYGVLLFALITLYMVLLAYAAAKSKGAEKKVGWTLFLALVLAASLNTVCYIVLPMMGSYDLSWLGPVALGAAMTIVYLLTIKYHAFSSPQRFLQNLAYVTVVIAAALIYNVLFYLIFILLFRGAAPSMQIIILNLVMVVIFIFCIPIFNHMFSITRGIDQRKG